MKKIISMIFVLLLASVSVLAGGPETKLQDNAVDQRITVMSSDAAVVEDLSMEETNGLLLMREEEKLAHDIYLALYEKWSSPIFSNIAASEQTHTEAIKSVLEAYDLEDPVASDSDRGVYSDERLTSLYNDLVAQGEESLTGALIVGATIEDLDIYDLDRLISQTGNEDLLLVYENLRKGSRNHMRSFIRQLETQGETYEAQYISESELTSIVEGTHEAGVLLTSESNIDATILQQKMLRQKMADSRSSGGDQTRALTGNEMNSEQQNNVAVTTNAQVQTQAKLQAKTAVQSGNYAIENGQKLVVQQQNENQLQLRSGSFVAKTEMNMMQEQSERGTKLSVQLSNGKNAEVKLMPDEASQKAMQQLRLKVCSEENGCQIELKEVGNGEQLRAAYEVRAQKQTKLFGIFGMDMNVQAQVDAETGEIIRENKPWWAFLASED